MDKNAESLENLNDLPKAIQQVGGATFLLPSPAAHTRLHFYSQQGCLSQCIPLAFLLFYSLEMFPMFSFPRGPLFILGERAIMNTSPLACVQMVI